MRTEGGSAILSLNLLRKWIKEYLSEVQMISVYMTYSKYTVKITRTKTQIKSSTVQTSNLCTMVLIHIFSVSASPDILVGIPSYGLDDRGIGVRF
jgi:hypothetical protein